MFDRSRNAIRKLRQDRRGNVLTLMGLSMIPLVGTLGIAVDVAQWISWKRDLRSAADSGAIAGAQSLRDGGDGDAVNAAVRKVLGYNTQHAYTIAKIESPPSVGAFAGNKKMVRVVLNTSQKLPFSSMFLTTTPVIEVEAIAEASREVANCMTALFTTGTVMSVAGSASVDMDCGMMSNGNFDATSSDTIRAGALSAAGTVTEGNNIAADTTVHNGVGTVSDPLAGKISDPNEVCDADKKFSGQNNTLSPGCYRSIEITSNSELILSAGTYYIGSGGIKVAGGAKLRGDGVTLVFTNTDSPFNSSKMGTFDAMGTSTVQLKAPTGGDNAGILMYQDSRTPFSNNTQLYITGNNKSEFEGSIYAPSTGVKFSGNSSMTTDCLQIGAGTVTFTGNTHVSNKCGPGRGVSSLVGQEVLRLRK